MRQITPTSGSATIHPRYHMKKTLSSPMHCHPECSEGSAFVLKTATFAKLPHRRQSNRKVEKWVAQPARVPQAGPKTRKSAAVRIRTTQIHRSGVLFSSEGMVNTSGVAVTVPTQ